MTKLQHKISKKNPFDNIEEETVLNLLHTSDLLQFQFRRLFRPFKLTEQQYNILRILRGHGVPMPSLAISKQMMTLVPAITGLIDRMEKGGWVTRKRCDKDRRVVYVAITDLGIALLDQLDEPVGALDKSLVGHLSPNEMTTLISLLEKIRQPLETT